MIILKNTDKKISHALHIADIHIRLTKRHDEYKSVFDKFYNALEKVNKDSTILVIAGDIFHNKSDLSPECIDIASEFLKTCADHIPTILIAGNHDATLANKNRLDSLSPIVNTLNHKNLFYLKDSGVYRYENILFNNYSVFDDPTEDFISYENIKSTYKLSTDHHIALFHGPVNEAITDIGYTINNRTILKSIFDGHHMVMLGDIHKHQVLQEYDYENDLPSIVYVGSMIQQNHGEFLKGHGFLYWDLEKKSFKHYELKNDYGFFTIEVKNGKLITDIADLPKKSRLRVKCFESIPSQIKEVVNSIKNNTQIVETTHLRVDNQQQDDVLLNKKFFDINNINDVDYQNKLLEEELVSREINEVVIDNIKNINKEINLNVSNKLVNNIRWKPKKFEFDNMFSYGEGNVVDFTKLNGAVGLFAPNASGKSSIMDALAFCLFDKFSRGYKASHVLNIQKMGFRCKFNFEINGIDYFIERKGKSDKNGNVKVNVDFWKEENDTITQLNGEARRNTNDIIRDYVGTYEDFLLTVLSVQNSKVGSFIDLGHTERKDLLCQFMGLNLFDQLHSIANDKFKETNTLLKSISKDELESDLSEIKEEIKGLDLKSKSYNRKLKSSEKEKGKFNDELLKLSNEVVNLHSLENLNILELEDKKIKYEDLIKISNENVLKFEKESDEVFVSLKELESSIKDCENIESLYEEYKEIKHEEEIKKSEIDKLKYIIKTKVDKLKKLEDHEYDPECNYCVNNVFVKDAISTKKDLEKEKVNASKIVSEYTKLKNKIDSYGDIELNYKKCYTVQNEKSSLERKLDNINSSKFKNEKILINTKSELKDVIKNIETFYKNEDIIKNNNKLIDEIEKIKEKINSIELEIKSINSDLFSVSNEKGKLEHQHKNLSEKLEEVKQLEDSYESYKLYTELISRDGIPYSIIKRILPEIENEINNILNQLVEFSISLETDGKNIMANIVYDDKKWPLEMSSGLEKFLSGLAIRVALIGISNLPRPNMICVDEGFGCADSDNLGQMSILFKYLVHRFDFIWIISHLDQMRDMVDEQIEIKKENGFSKINYV